MSAALSAQWQQLGVLTALVLLIDCQCRDKILLHRLKMEGLYQQGRHTRHGRATGAFWHASPDVDIFNGPTANPHSSRLNTALPTAFKTKLASNALDWRDWLHMLCWCTDQSPGVGGSPLAVLRRKRLRPVAFPLLEWPLSEAPRPRHATTSFLHVNQTRQSLLSLQCVSSRIIMEGMGVRA